MWLHGIGVSIEKNPRLLFYLSLAVPSLAIHILCGLSGHGAVWTMKLDLSSKLKLGFSYWLALLDWPLVSQSLSSNFITMLILDSRFLFCNSNDMLSIHLVISWVGQNIWVGGKSKILCNKTYAGLRRVKTETTLCLTVWGNMTGQPYMRQWSSKLLVLRRYNLFMHMIISQVSSNFLLHGLSCFSILH